MLIALFGFIELMVLTGCLIKRYINSSIGIIMRLCVPGIIMKLCVPGIPMRLRIPGIIIETYSCYSNKTSYILLGASLIILIPCATSPNALASF